MGARHAPSMLQMLRYKSGTCASMIPLNAADPVEYHAAPNGSQWDDLQLDPGLAQWQGWYGMVLESQPQPLLPSVQDVWQV